MVKAVESTVLVVENERNDAVRCTALRREAPNSRVKTTRGKTLRSERRDDQSHHELIAERVAACALRDRESEGAQRRIEQERLRCESVRRCSRSEQHERSARANPLVEATE